MTFVSNERRTSCRRLVAREINVCKFGKLLSQLPQGRAQADFRLAGFVDVLSGFDQRRRILQNARSLGLRVVPFSTAQASSALVASSDRFLMVMAFIIAPPI
jgi:hypothetical protein